MATCCSVGAMICPYGSGLGKQVRSHLDCERWERGRRGPENWEAIERADLGDLIPPRAHQGSLQAGKEHLYGGHWQWLDASELWHDWRSSLCERSVQERLRARVPSEP
eukprot:1156387-Pelagomonas_calceolata.AAC.10